MTIGLDGFADGRARESSAKKQTLASLALAGCWN